MKRLAQSLCLILILGLFATPGFAQENSCPFTLSEFMQFLEDVPTIPGFTAESQQAMDEDSFNDIAFSEAIREQIKALGWNEARFIYVYSHTVSVVSVEQMQQAFAQMQAQLQDMPEEQKQMMLQMMGGQMGEQMTLLKADVDARVPASEQTIIRDNISAVYSTLGIPLQ